MHGSRDCARARSARSVRARRQYNRDVLERQRPAVRRQGRDVHRPLQLRLRRLKDARVRRRNPPPDGDAMAGRARRPPPGPRHDSFHRLAADSSRNGWRRAAARLAARRNQRDANAAGRAWQGPDRALLAMEPLHARRGMQRRDARRSMETGAPRNSRVDAGIATTTSQWTSSQNTTPKISTTSHAPPSPNASNPPRHPPNSSTS